MNVVDKISKLDSTKRVDELLISQYYESDNLKEYIKSFAGVVQEVYSSMVDSINSRSIDIAIGHSLDKIATTVGTNRVIAGAAALGYFGFAAEPTAEGLGLGVFYSYGDATAGDLLLTDVALRRSIRAKIIQNTKAGSIEDIILFMELLIGRSLDIEIKEGKAHIDLRFHENLTPQDKAILVVKALGMTPAGVSITLSDNNGVIEPRRGI